MLEDDWQQSMGSTTLTWAPLTGGFAGDGAPTFASSSAWQSAPAIVQYDRRLVTRPNGETEVASATIFVLSTSAAIGLQDRLTVPGTTEQPRLLRVDAVGDDTGQHHLEVLIA